MSQYHNHNVTFCSFSFNPCLKYKNLSKKVNKQSKNIDCNVNNTNKFRTGCLKLIIYNGLLPITMNRKINSQDSSKCEYSTVGRAQSTLSVSAVDYYLNLPSPPSPAISTVTLTPGRIRNIDQDMEALRASRQDNPFLQQVIASRESLADCLEEESDDANLMSKEFPMDLEIDPLSLPEMHEHMIRSPPPTNWPKSPNYRMFQFPNEDETLHVEVSTSKERSKYESKPKHSSWDGSDCSPLKSLPRPHVHHQDRFSLLTPNALRSSAEDSVHLMSSDE